MKDQFFARFAEALEVDAGSIGEDSVFKTLANWDSLAALSVIAMIDEFYGASIGGDDLERSTTLGELWQLVAAKSA